MLFRSLSLLGVDNVYTTTFQMNNMAFMSSAKFRFQVDDGYMIYVKPEGRIYYNNAYPTDINDIDDLVDSKANSDGKLTIISDGEAPRVKVMNIISGLFSGFVPIELTDVGSGVAEVTVYDSSGRVYMNKTIQGRETSLLLDREFYLYIEKDSMYSIVARDNVGNKSEPVIIKVFNPKSYTVNAKTGGDYCGYNSRYIISSVFGGSSEVASFLILSEEEDRKSVV